jgi:hypothetical protein
LTGAFYSPKILVFARTAAEVTSALDVLDGKSPSLAGKDSPLGAKVPAGAMFVGRATGLAEANLPWKSPLLNQSESVATALTVTDDALAVEVRLVARSEESAPLLKDVIQGGVAMAKLQFGPDEGLTAMFKALKVEVAGKTVTVAWRGPSVDVWTQTERAYGLWQQGD